MTEPVQTEANQSEVDGELIGLDRTRTVPTRLLWVVGTLEALSLAALLLNLAVANTASVAQAVGPVHGLLYLTGIVLVWSNRFPRSAKLIVVVPAIGALIAARLHASRNDRSTSKS